MSTLETEEDLLSTLNSNTPPDSPVDGTMSTVNLQTDITTTDQCTELDEQNAEMQIPSSSNQPSTLDNNAIQPLDNAIQPFDNPDVRSPSSPNQPTT
jgi:hypothetical protein